MGTRLANRVATYPLLTNAVHDIIAEFSATDSIAEYKFEDAFQTLRVRALKVDTIKVCGIPYSPSLCDSMDITEHIIFNQWFDLAIENLSDTDIEAAFASTLAMDGEIMTAHRGESIRPDNVRLHFNHWSAKNLAAVDASICEEHGRDESARYGYLAEELCRHRTFFITGMGLGSVHISPGDSVCLIHGLQTPFIVGSCGGSHALRGECYINGMMGAMVKQSEADEYLVFS